MSQQQVTIKATILMNSNYQEFEEKKVEHAFAATFASDGSWSVTPNQFGEVLVEDIPTGREWPRTVDLRVRLRQRALGQHDVTGGTLSIDGEFSFSIAIGVSYLDIQLAQGSFKLTTGSGSEKEVIGMPITPHSTTCQIAGLGTFSGGVLDGSDCLVQLSGNFTGKPW